MAESFNHWHNLAAALDGALAGALDKAAEAAAEHVKAAISSNGQVATGNMQAGIVAVTAKRNEYPGGASVDVLPLSVSQPSEAEGVAYVVAAAGYSIYQDQGTRYQPARPFMQPGIRDGARDLQHALEGMGEDWAHRAGVK